MLKKYFVMDFNTIAIFACIAIAVFLMGRRIQLRQPAESQPERQVLKRPIFGSWTIALASLLPISTKKEEKLATDLLASGKYSAKAIDDFLASRNVGLVIVILIVAAVFASGLADGFETAAGIGAVVVVVVTYALPRVILSGRASRRLQRIERQVPDALDMIALSVAAGLAVSRALEQVSVKIRRSHPELGQELEILCRQAEAGSLENAFAGFSKRIKLPEIVSWSTMMQQSQRLGGNLADSLFAYARRIREDRKNQAERKGNLASLKLLLPVVLFLSPPIAIMLIGPAILDFRDFINRERGEVQRLVELSAGANGAGTGVTSR